MCSRLHVQLSTGLQVIQPGDSIPYRQGNKPVQEATWGIPQYGGRHQGFARVESWEQKWLTKGWRPCVVPSENFAEGHETVRWAGVNGDIAALHRAGVVVVITRQATAAEFAKLDHHRVPVQVINRSLTLPSKGGPDWLANRS